MPCRLNYSETIEVTVGQGWVEGRSRVGRGSVEGRFSDPNPNPIALTLTPNPNPNLTLTLTYVALRNKILTYLVSSNSFQHYL